ncbi:hypothetical protein AB4179_19495 [Vibrio lentus]|uniref:hypothetical protein n=1 Tax=Vibrio lentus TaxID=136468 RepID=UPI0024699465|nr:hypothetical protein [Vibrio lentus]MDH5928936.1 hypothetical protein [Vibrio lentus]
MRLSLKVSTSLLGGIILMGCASTSNIAGKYEPTPRPELSGYWFSNDANQAQYLLIRDDGTGEICWEQSANYKSTPIVISNNKMVSTMEGDIKITESGFDNCVWGFCAHFTKIQEHRIASQCKKLLSVEGE